MGVGLPEASVEEVPRRFCFRKKEAYCSFPGCGIQGVTGRMSLLKPKEDRESKGQRDSVDSMRVWQRSLRGGKAERKISPSSSGERRRICLLVFIGKMSSQFW